MSDDYMHGWQEGREQARQEFESAWKLMSKHASDLLLENHELRARQQCVSVRRILWSRIKGLFRRTEHDL